ncbi:MAG TPA: SDR family oxidoreductase [Polaromonas sp.]|uniref:SDR family oxidoreductase n=1 Tax=Polaromonas sp. TaxID=1869339 RepID=UPI002D5D4FAA|nr:SDR family oxidoreductase [Polaromonas sp.]HYW56245.1 SDR family oxidoreductase [Polaromonas sp.]
MSTVLVIGASRGIGLEFVRQYRADGARVIASARNAAGLARLTALGAQALKLDVADPASVSGLAWQLDGEKIDVALYVAGILAGGNAGDPPPEAEFDLVMRTNVLAPMRVLPQLVEVLAPDARLVVLSSRMGSIGLRTNGDSWLYRASKSAVNSVVKDISFGVQGKAICVAMHPGWVKTDMGGAGADLDVTQSVADMRTTVASLRADHNGTFINHDGQALAW